MPIGSGSSIDTSIPERAKEERKELLQLSDLIEELAERGGGLPSRDATVAILQLAQKVIDEQNIEIQHLRKQLFGRRSEKVSPNQLSFFAEMLQTLVEEEPEPEEKKRKKKKKKIKRRPLEPTRTEEIKVPDEERPCPVCGKERCPMHPVRSLVVEYQPAKIEVIEYLREQLVCRPCEGEITVAPQPEERVIDRALPGPKMLASLVVNKTVDGLPLRRSQRIFKRAGLDIPIATLSRWEGFAHQLLGPVIQLAKKKVLEADTINTDDTGIRVRDPEIARGTWSGHIWSATRQCWSSGKGVAMTP